MTARTPASGATGVSTSTTVTATFSEAVQSNTINITLTGPGSSVSGQRRLRLCHPDSDLHADAALAASTTYTATCQGAKDLAGNTMAPAQLDFHHRGGQPADCPCTIWPSSATPAVAADPDTGGDRGRRQVPHHTRPARSPGSGSTKARVTPGPTSASCGPRPARNSQLSPSPARAPAAGSRRPSRLRSRSPPTPPTWPPITRQTAITQCRKLLHFGHYSGAAHRAAERDRRRQRRLPIRHQQRIPELGLSIKQLLGRRRPDDELATTSPGDKSMRSFVRGRIRTEQKHPADSLARACPQLRFSRSPASEPAAAATCPCTIFTGGQTHLPTRRATPPPSSWA